LTRVEIGHIRMSFGRVRLQQIARIWIIAQPAIILLRAQNCWHTIVNLTDEFVGPDRDDCKRVLPLSSRVLPVLPKACDPKRRAVAHRYRERLLRLRPLIAFHSKNPSTGRMQRRRA
jgi:hypothetical protein